MPGEFVHDLGVLRLGVAHRFQRETDQFRHVRRRRRVAQQAVGLDVVRVLLQNFLGGEDGRLRVFLDQALRLHRLRSTSRKAL